jgi:putative transposase
MPWEERNAMTSREEFVLRALEPNASMTQLCLEYQISRKTGYKWLARYKKHGMPGLVELSRRPRRSPLAVDGEVVVEVVAIRQAHPKWGAKKIHAIMQRSFEGKIPTERTIVRILERTGLLQPRRRKRFPPRPQTAAPKLTIEAPNDVWTVDFKGWWLTEAGERCEPLTVRDAFSRFVLLIEVLPSTRHAPIIVLFEKLFARYGLPKVILTDNGPPFVAPQSKVGLTQLSAWWVSLGIDHVRTRPATPGDNAAHERMHRDMAEELEAFSAFTRREQQAACERWRHDFNFLRPHEALGMKTPGDVYRRSVVNYLEKPAETVYPKGFHVRTVSKIGRIRIRGRQVFISWALGSYTLGLRYCGEGVFETWLSEKYIGKIDCKVVPATFTPEIKTVAELLP